MADLALPARGGEEAVGSGEEGQAAREDGRDSQPELVHVLEC